MQTNFVLVLVATIASMGGLLIAVTMETYAQPNTNMSMAGSADSGTEPGTEPGVEPGAQPCSNMTGSAEPGYEPGAEPGTEPGVEPCK